MSEDRKDIVVGLGTPGIKLAVEFSKYSAYDEVWCIDHEGSDNFEGLDSDINTLTIDEQTNGGKYAHEKYDRDYEVFRRFAEDRENQNIYFIVCGTSDISGCSLRFLGNLDKDSISMRVIYIRPDLNFESNIKRMQERVTRNILQEYARSGKMEEITLLSNRNVESFLDGVSVKDYFSKINSLMVYSVHMVNYCRNIKPEYDNLSDETEHIRIKTIGYQVEDEEHLLYPMKRVRDEVTFPVEKFYYYLVTDERLENDVDLLNNIKNRMMNKKEDLTDVSYAIFSSGDDEDQVLFEYNTSLVQD